LSFLSQETAMTHRASIACLTLVLLIPAACSATFSIAAYDAEAEEWGIAVASREVAVGAFVPWVEAGAGAVATQALISPSFGIDGLAMMREGRTAEETLAALLESDADEAEQRQVALIDARGGVAVFSGERIGSVSGSRKGVHYSIQGNTLASEDVLSEMEAAFLDTDGPLALRLLAAITAGDSAGGDRRGRQSAALRVARANSGIRGQTDRLVDLRIDNHPNAPEELVEAFMHWAHQILVFNYLESDDESDLVKGELLVDWIVDYERAKETPEPSNIHRMARYMLLSGLEPERALELRREHFDAAWQDDPMALNKFAWFCFQYGLNLEEAELLARRGVDASDGADRANVLDTLAEVVNARGRAKEAIELIEEAIRLAPETEYFRDQKRKFEESLGSGEQRVTR
jgi:uncharacterized Ntn-hydrolase superfamily protein